MMDSFMRRLFDRRKQTVVVAQERRKPRMTPARATEHLFKSIDNLECTAKRIQGTKRET